MGHYGMNREKNLSVGLDYELPALLPPRCRAPVSRTSPEAGHFILSDQAQSSYNRPSACLDALGRAKRYC